VLEYGSLVCLEWSYSNNKIIWNIVITLILRLERCNSVDKHDDETNDNIYIRPQVWKKLKHEMKENNEQNINTG